MITGIENLKEKINKELKEGILAFWEREAVDNINGGFYGNIRNNNQKEEQSPKGLIQNTRNLWSFSRAYNYYRDPKYLELAKRAKNYLTEYFWDNEFGGFIWEVDYMGQPTNTRKQVYGQAFGIYALSEYYIASKDSKAIDLADKLYELLENNAYDPQNNGYLEAMTCNWDEIDDVRLSEVDLNEKKSNNTHLHLMEAYTTYHKVKKNTNICLSLKNLVDIMLNKIMDKDTLNFTLFFDEVWTKKSSTISFGHEIEAAWLIYEALLEIEDMDYLNHNLEIITSIIENCYKNYLHGKNGEMGMYNEDDGNGNVDKTKIWWVQAEACVGFYLGYQITGDKKYLETVKNIWSYIEEYFVDKENGEWFWVGKDNETQTKSDFKVMNWKSFYHNSRACIELLERIIP